MLTLQVECWKLSLILCQALVSVDLHTFCLNYQLTFISTVYSFFHLFTLLLCVFRCVLGTWVMVLVSNDNFTKDFFFFTLFWVLRLKLRLSGWQGYHLYLLSHLANPQCFYSQMSYLATFKNNILWYYFQFSYYRQLFAYFSLLNNSNIPDL